MSKPHRSPLPRILVAVISATTAIVVLIAAIALFLSRQRDPVAVPPLAVQEADAMLSAAGEPVEWRVPAFRRHWWDYFRPTRGMLLATERRIVFVGVVPEPLALMPVEEPPAIERLSFHLDSATLAVRSSALHGTRGIEIVRHTGRSEFFGIHPRVWQRAESLLTLVAAVQRARQEEAEAIRLARQMVEEEARRPLYHHVTRGETLIGIARRYGLTHDSLARLNNMEGTRLRVGDSLLVREGRE